MTFSLINVSHLQTHYLRIKKHPKRYEAWVKMQSLGSTVFLCNCNIKQIELLFAAK